MAVLVYEAQPDGLNPMKRTVELVAEDSCSFPQSLAELAEPKQSLRAPCGQPHFLLSFDEHDLT
jgi:hypothetical protein